MACFVCLEQLPARPLIFSFGSGVTFGAGRGTAGGCFVGCLVAYFVCLEQLPARPLIFSFGSGVTFGPGRGTAGGCFVTPCHDFFIRFRSDVWPGQRDGRRLFRHALPGCFPDLKGALARRDETASCHPSARAKRRS